MPPGAVAARLCSYSGLRNSHDRVPKSLIRSRLVDTAGPLVDLTADFNALPPIPRIVCPLGNGSEIVALIAYSSGPPLTITLRRTGCIEVTNGALLRSASYNPAAEKLNDELLRLLGQARWP
jgi:hypothetical protein